jgi:hypothetical protein
LDGARCVSDLDANTVCAMGTHFENKQCMPDSRLRCGTGTHPSGDLCLADSASDTGPTIWKKNVVAKSTYCAEPSMAIDGAGVIFIGCMSASNVYLLRSNDQGDSFTEIATFLPTNIRGGFVGDVTVAVDAQDRVYFAWVDYVGRNTTVSGAIFGAIFGKGGMGGGEPVQISAADPQNPFSDRPWLAVAPTGEVYISYSHGSYSPPRLGTEVTTSKDGERFAPPTWLESPPTGYNMVLVSSPLAFGPGGTPYAIEASYSVNGLTGDATTVARTLVKTAGGWSPGGTVENLLDFQHFGYDHYPLIASGSNGTLHSAVVNAPSRKPAVYLAKSTDGATWSKPIAPNLSAGLQQLPWLSIDEAGGVHLIFLDNRAGAWNVYSLHSRDGDEFGPLQRVNDQAFPEDGTQTQWIGDFNSIVARRGTVYAAWTDTRSGESRVMFSSAPTPIP